jgi:predicted DCC family thiol-disulfide oxidoreductase YuxK
MFRTPKKFYFTIDQRSLGLFRILLGSVLIFDWLSRWPHLEAFYTSFGFLPIEAPLPRAGGGAHFSLLDGFTSLPMVQLFFCLGLCCYILFLLGYRTKPSSVLTFLFFASVSNRNIVIRHGGDVVLVTLLLWSLFLPLGQRFSIDAVIAAVRRGVDLRPTSMNCPLAKEMTLCRPSLAAFVITCQIALIYGLTAFDKHGQEWINGTALYYTLHIDQFVTPLGAWVATLPLDLLRVLTWGTLALEVAAAPLILLPIAQPLLRRVAMIGLTALHAGTWLTMELGSFPFVMISSYALLLQPADWECIRRWSLRWSRAVTVYYDNTGCGLCERICQLLAIADREGNIRFLGKTDPARYQHTTSKTEPNVTLIAFDRATHKESTKSAAVATILRALPLPFHAFRIIAAPGLRLLSDQIYDFIDRNRYPFSDWLGLEADGPARAAKDIANRTSEDASPVTRVWRRTLDTLANAAVALIFVSVLLDSYNLNLAGHLGMKKIPEPTLVRAIIGGSQLVHNWHLFAPSPMKDDGWWVIEGVTESGERFDPLTGKAPTWEKPAGLARRYGVFWRKYLYRLWLADYFEYRLYFAKYLTRKNHREKPSGQRLVKFSFYYVLETTLPPGGPKPFPTERRLLWEHHCLAGKPDAIPERKP